MLHISQRRWGKEGIDDNDKDQYADLLTLVVMADGDNDDDNYNDNDDTLLYNSQWRVGAECLRLERVTACGHFTCTSW